MASANISEFAFLISHLIYHLAFIILHLVRGIKGVRLHKNSDTEWLLCVADNVEVNTPIELQINAASNDLILTVQVGLNSKVTVIERFQESKDADIHYHHQINADSYSKLKIITIQNLPLSTKLTEIRDIKASRSADVHIINLQLGGKEVRGSIKQNALSEDCNISIDLLSRTSKSQKHHFDFSNTFSARNGRGKITAKGIALDKSSLTFNGAIQIEQTGSGTDTYLRQDCLLLSKNAKVKSTPALKIDTDNVKASHGAGISNINDESMFYLTSRGLSPDSARRLLINGFVAEVVDKVKDLPDVSEYVTRNL